MLMRNKADKTDIIETIKWLGFKTSYCFASLHNGVDTVVTKPSWFNISQKRVIVPLKESPIINLNEFWRVNDELYLGTGEGSVYIPINHWLVKKTSNKVINYTAMDQVFLLNNYSPIVISGRS